MNPAKAKVALLAGCGVLALLVMTACTSAKGGSGTILARATPVGVPAPVGGPASDEAAIIAQRSAAARKASITDTSVHSPVETIKGCKSASSQHSSARRWVYRGSAVSKSLQAALQSAQTYSDQHGGKGLIILHNGALLHESYAAGVDRDTPFTSLSLHKTMLALAVAAAVQDGVIGSLDDGLGAYIPQWADDPRGTITLRQAMQMASGLEQFPLATGDPRGLALLFGTDSVGTALSAMPTTKPGSQFTYKNGDAQIVGFALAQALERKGKGRYAQYLSKRIWCPLGNSDGSLLLDRAGGSAQYFAGVNTTLRSWANVGEAIQSARLGSRRAPSALDDMLSPSPTNPNYGLFTWLGAPQDGKRRYSAESPVFVPHSMSYRVKDMAFMDGFGGQRVYIIGVLSPDGQAQNFTVAAQ